MTLDFNRPILFASSEKPDLLFLVFDGFVFNMQDNHPIETRTPVPQNIVQHLYNLKLWKFIGYVNIPEEEELIEDEEEDEEIDEVYDGASDGIPTSGAIKSDGGSSTYYDIALPEWLVERILERSEYGKAYIKTEELIEVAFKSDFDAGNVLKSLVRLFGAFNGAGKEGNSVNYEKKKIEYSVNKLAQRFERQEAA